GPGGALDNNVQRSVVVGAITVFKSNQFSGKHGMHLRLQVVGAVAKESQPVGIPTHRSMLQGCIFIQLRVASICRSPTRLVILAQSRGPRPACWLGCKPESVLSCLEHFRNCYRPILFVIP